MMRSVTDGAGPLLDLHRLTRHFGDVVAVDGVDLAVGSHEIVGLIGANGAGKTTLIRMALGLLRPTAGRVRLLGRPPSREARARIGYVPQGLGLYRDLTVRENLRFVADTFGVEAGDAGLLGGLDEQTRRVAGRLVGELSLGLQRRVGFAAALLHEPELLVLDEPTSGVDPLGRARLWDTVRDAADAGAGVLVTTHHLGEATRCDRLVLVAAGRVVARGTPDEIVGDATVVTVTAARWADAFDVLAEHGQQPSLDGRRLRIATADAGRVRRLLADAGVEAQVATAPASLEERFVELAA